MRERRQRARRQRSSGATSRWTATSAGTASQRAYDLLVARRGASTSADTAVAAVRPPTSATRPTSSSSPTVVGRRSAAIRPGDAVFAFNFRPDRDARDHPRARRARLRRVRPRRRAAGRALRDDDRVPGGLGLPGRVPAGRGPRSRWPRCIADAGGAQLHVAETEKYAHVTYFFNGGEEDAVRRARSASSCLAARRAHLRPEAGDERPRARPTRSSRRWREDEPRFGDHQLRQPGHGRPHGRHPGGGRRRSRRVDACLADVVDGRPRVGRRVRHHRRPRQRRPHARARRLAEHRAHAQPGAVHRHVEGGRPAIPTAGSSPTSRRPSSLCSPSSSRRR